MVCSLQIGEKKISSGCFDLPLKSSGSSQNNWQQQSPGVGKQHKKPYNLYNENYDVVLGLYSQLRSQNEQS